MTDPNSAFAKMVPGFDFLQGLVKNAGAAIPGMGQWIAPTLDPEELDKRINDLKTVQFWLEQNARLMATTVQALEVQRMTLATLKGMNVSMGDLTESLKIRMPQAPAPASPPAPEPAAAPPAAAAPAAPVVPPGVADPMQWWGALTKQFTEIATNAMKDTAGEAAKQVAKQVAAQAVQQGVEAASETLKKAAGLPAQMAQGAAAAAQQMAAAGGSALAAVVAPKTPGAKAQAAPQAAKRTAKTSTAPARKAAPRRPAR